MHHRHPPLSEKSSLNKNKKNHELILTDLDIFTKYAFPLP